MSEEDKGIGGGDVGRELEGIVALKFHFENLDKGVALLLERRGGTTAERVVLAT